MERSARGSRRPVQPRGGVGAAYVPAPSALGRCDQDRYGADLNPDREVVGLPNTDRSLVPVTGVPQSTPECPGLRLWPRSLAQILGPDLQVSLPTSLSAQVFLVQVSPV
jgi:hypothetical protein